MSFKIGGGWIMFCKLGGVGWIMFVFGVFLMELQAPTPLSAKL